MSTLSPSSSPRPKPLQSHVLPGSLPERFTAISALHGERTAITLGDAALSYAGLDRASSRIAAALGPQLPGALVALCLERTPEAIAAMLGVLKTGAAYLPLDPGYPVARLAETIADASPAAVITTRGLASRLRHIAVPIVFLEDLLLCQSQPPALLVHPDDPAYVIYTSGSTGSPKGVVVSHRNLTRLLDRTQPCFRFSPQDVWTMFHSFAFDFSVWEIWGCLLSGGRLVLVPFGVSRAPDEFHALLARERVTVLNQTPSAFALLDQQDARTPLTRLHLRLVICGGEPLAPPSLRPWFERLGDRAPQMVNMYGITETTIHATFRRLTPADALLEHECVIGEPLPDLQLHLLDSFLRPVGVGEEGEICIGGAGVSSGYLNRPDLTAERFVPDPFRGGSARLYRSGDLARRRPDGELVFLGRRDSQVQINGFRIELGEIESVLLTHPAIAQACVLAHAAPGRTPRLSACFVCRPGLEPGTREIAEFLAARLPAQMMPAFYQRLAVFPLNPNGKVDRSALPVPCAGSHLPDRRSLAAASSLEELVASIWRVVLKAKTISLDDHFLDIGGTSLLLIAVRTGIQEQLDRQIPVAWMFEYTTVRSLAQKLAGH